MGDTYLTITKEGEGLYREKMSRFLSFSLHIDSREEAMERIKWFQNRYHDARHVCWAYMLGADRSVWQLNDNGEPSGTAGKPILGQINSKGVTNVLVVVVRYFGGIKLGTSGLIVAYKESARMALENAVIEEFHEMENLKIEFRYEDMNGIMNVIKNENLEISDRLFDNNCSMTIKVRKDYLNRIQEIISKKGAKLID